MIFKHIFMTHANGGICENNKAFKSFFRALDLFLTSFDKDQFIH